MIPATDRPTTNSPARYVIEWNGQTETGLTATQVAELLESERYRDMRIYRIHRLDPNGRMELVGVPRDRFQLEDCFLFYRRSECASRGDFDALVRAAERTPPPCRARVQLAEVGAAAGSHVVAIVYPAEFSGEMSAWLAAIQYAGGDTVEGGTSDVAGYESIRRRLIDRAQLWGTEDGTLAATSTDRLASGA
ncbi:MAG: hypothetical protein L6Q92_02985 [Phycisphaerae bacterium]|nr:hypothetical protein [Phycisphaerae bacterium]